MLTFAIITMSYIRKFQELNGRSIRVSYANERQAGPPRSFGSSGGGGYRGGYGGGDEGY